jgi:hypothetical protein
MNLRLLPIALLLGSALPALAWDEDYTHGRIRYQEPGVVLQRADESSAEEAVVNTPFLPGDRVWTDRGGRVEFQFQDGTLVRLDSGSKLDYVAHDERDERIVLRLWSGSAWIVTRDRGALEIETPGALVLPGQVGSYRVDSDASETVLSVFEGEARFESGREGIDVREGERSFAERGGVPDDPRRFDRRTADDFQTWNESRDDRTGWANSTPSYVPEVVRPYAQELETGGSWYFVADVGHVWRPYVAPGWQPYTNGRWTWTSYGYTWIPYESWGWATSHYGRWGHSGSVGWYWIPGQAWSPAWVSWTIGHDYVGWCPLGRGDRPVAYAASRGVLRADASPWSYTRRTDLTAADVARRRVVLPSETIKTLHVADTPQARPTRDVRGIEVQAAPRTVAVPRNVRMGLSPGDAAPEIAQDNKIAVPAPVLRRVRPREEGDAERSNATRDDPARSGERGEVSSSRTRRSDPTVAGQGDDDAASTTTRREPASGRSAGSYGRDREPETTRPTSSETRKPSSATRRDDSDRDVLRRIFRPLTERPTTTNSGSGSDTRSASPRSEPRSEPRTTQPRSEPRQAPPPTQRPQPQQSPRSGGSSARERDH